ncbi:hypothetical protein [Microbacterium sp. Yaish 1]|uniref:hypothetical protein n=1 Tax=Microbacterium sp. Yaish 1 TaxID=2025014 RepID=UPI000B94362D|nr:hypothetical protein [Microbacterium sp. Yaish 1]OYC97734.1 hypothetical protein CI089_04150 [Microbacterium sp. Yaish 1]
MTASPPAAHSAPRVIARSVVSDGGLTPRGRAAAGILAIVLLLALVAGLAAANALPFAGAPGHTVGADDAAERREASTHPSARAAPTGNPLQAEWNGPTVSLDWRGVPYARAETSFIGDRTAAPGDRAMRALDVVNAGPGPGVMTVTLDAMQHIPALAENPDLAEDVTIFWEVGGVEGSRTFDALAASGRVELAQLALDRSEQTRIVVGFAMPAEIDRSRALGAPSTILSFDVGVEMRGDGSDAPPGLAATGGQIAAAAIAAAALLSLLGLLLLARRRDRVCDLCERELSRRDARVTVRAPGGNEDTLCVECARAGVLL